MSMTGFQRSIRAFLARVMRGVALYVEPKIDISNHFVNGLCYANSGMLERGNLWCFDHAIRNLPSEAPIVEIGSFCGLSTNLLTYYKQLHGRRNTLITCDKWEFEGAEPGQPFHGCAWISHESYREHVKQTYIRNISFFSSCDPPYTIERTSDEFFTAWREGREVVDVLGRPIRLGGPISFCYIDGNHSYEYVLRDFQNVDAHLQPGGFILFDDSYDGTCFEVSRVIAQVKTLPRYRLVAKNPNYLFRKT